MDSDNEQNDLYEYTGERDDNEEPHGTGVEKYESGNEFKGNFVHGKKNGQGVFYFADGSSLEATYKDNNIHGTAIYKYDDGSSIENTYIDNELNGPSFEYDAENNLTFHGQYEDGVRKGICWFYYSDGGMMCGCVHENGELTGNNVFYIYPDQKTSLIGTYEEGELIKAFAAEISMNGDKGNEEGLPEVIKLKKDVEFKSDISTKDILSKYPMLKDPYENNLVYVAKSNIENADEGLFLKKEVDAGTVVAFYNGLRITHNEVDERDWSLNENTISLDDISVIDVPKQYSSTDVYCASLGHKVNHSFDSNCKYDLYQHPRFGSIKCIRTIRPVDAGEELTVHYTYEHNFEDDDKAADAPLWYRQQLKQFGEENAALVLEGLSSS